MLTTYITNNVTCRDSKDTLVQMVLLDMMGGLEEMVTLDQKDIWVTQVFLDHVEIRENALTPLDLLVLQEKKEIKEQR